MLAAEPKKLIGLEKEKHTSGDTEDDGVVLELSEAVVVEDAACKCDA